MAKVRQMRLQVLRNGIHLSDQINVIKSDPSGLQFSIDVINATTGHAVPTGFDAERLFFLEVTVTDSHGNKVYVSGDRDPNGDVRDSHSVYVHNGELPLDEDLFSLQSIFLVRTIRGGEREQVLPTNLSADVLPFVRPEMRATTLVGHPLGARKHKQTIEPLGHRTATYNVPANKLRSGEHYTNHDPLHCADDTSEPDRHDSRRGVRLRPESCRDRPSSCGWKCSSLDTKR